MVIIQTPAPLSFSGNLKEFIINNNSDLSFKLEVLNGLDSTILIEENYTPEIGLISIDVKDVIDRQLQVNIPSGSLGLWIQTNSCKDFRYTIGDLPPALFTVIKGGLDNVTDSFNASTFLLANFLTWQPQEKKIQIQQPEFLSYYFSSNEKLIINAFYKDATESIQLEPFILYEHTGAPAVICFDLSWSKVSSLYADIAVLAYDVAIYDLSGVTRLSYVQRYVPVPTSDNGQSFLFVNTLGGLDTLHCSGSLSFLPKTSSDLVSLSESQKEVNRNFEERFSQNTGFIPDKNYALWLLDFFLSDDRSHVTSGGLRKILIPEQDQDWSKQSLGGFVFEFLYADRTNYNFINRLDILPEIIDFIDPSALFFLELRLADYPIASLDEDLLIPVQNRFGNTWKSLALKDLLQLYGSAFSNISIPLNEQGQTIGLDKEVVDGTIILSLKLEDITPETLEEGHQPILLNSIGELYCMGVGVEANGAIHKAVGSDGSIVLSLKTEMESVETVEAGHIKIQMNDGGELYGEMKWVEIYEGIQL